MTRINAVADSKSAEFDSISEEIDQALQELSAAVGEGIEELEKHYYASICRSPDPGPAPTVDPTRSEARGTK